jgi:hypothetical protein
MAISEERIGRVVDLWYAAGFGECQWVDALHATADLIGGGGGAILSLDRRNTQVDRIYVDGFDDTVNEYVARMNGINPRMIHSLKRAGPHVVTDYRVMPEAALGRNEFYDWIERHHGVRYFVGSRIFDDGPMSLFASVEFTRHHGHADDGIVETFKRIIPHIANACARRAQRTIAPFRPRSPASWTPDRRKRRTAAAPLPCHGRADACRSRCACCPASAAAGIAMANCRLPWS